MAVYPGFSSATFDVKPLVGAMVSVICFTFACARFDHHCGSPRVLIAGQGCGSLFEIMMPSIFS